MKSFHLIKQIIKQGKLTKVCKSIFGVTSEPFGALFYYQNKIQVGMLPASVVQRMSICNDLSDAAKDEFVP